MDLTIIIPTRDRHARLAECISALDHNDAEIIVVDDASEEPVAVQSDTTRVIRHDRHRGRSACINTGLKAASREAVLIVNDDIYAAPDMVVRLYDEFAANKNPKLGLKARVTWDPDVPLTATMKWMEEVHKFPSPMLLSRSFLLEHGGYDENFTRRLEDTELEVRLKKHGLEVRRIEAAVGFQHNMLKIRDLAEREFTEGVSAVFLHAKFPQFVPQVDDMETLLRNEAQGADADAAVEEIAIMEGVGSSEMPEGASELYAHVCRHYFLHGIFEGLKDIGGMKPQRNSSSTFAVYREATRLKEMGECDEARRLFRLVLQRPDEQYWDRAEYHLGCIEATLGNSQAARMHFAECLRLNPTHNEARKALNKPEHYREVGSNIFEIIDQAGPTKLVVAVLGGLGHVVSAMPVAAALRKKFDCETAWLTSSEYAGLARASRTGAVYEANSRGTIPWDWIHSEGFTHVFFLDPRLNQEDWEQDELNPADLARKCGVEIEPELRLLEPDAETIAQAEEFLREHSLKRNGFVTASYGGGEGRHWPNSNLMKLAQHLDMRTVVFGKKGDLEIPDTVACLDQPLEVIALLMSWSSFYLGPAHGISWLATLTDTPMALFFDPKAHHDSQDNGFGGTRLSDQTDIQQWDIYTNVQTVLEHIESRVLTPQ